MGPVSVDASAIEDNSLSTWVFLVDGQTVDTSLLGTPTYHWQWQATPGPHVLQVRAVDVCYKVGQSAPLTVEVAANRPLDVAERSALIRVPDGPTDPPGPPVVVGDLVDFGATLPDHAGSAHRLSLLNDGGTPLHITGLNLSGNAFRFRPAPPTLPLTVNGSTARVFFEIESTGQGTGIVQETLTIDHDGPGGSIQLVLRVNVDPVDAEVFLAPRADGFESGSPSLIWDGTYGTPAPLVKKGATLHGEYGLDVSFAGASGQSFLYMNLPASKRVVRSELWFDPNSLALDAGAEQSIAAWVAADGTPIGWLQLKLDGGYQVPAVALLDDGSQAGTPWVSIPDQPQKLTFDWWAASARGIANGGIRIRQNAGGAAAEVRTLDNDLKVVDQFRLGALWGVTAGTEGHLYFDDVAVTF